MNGSSRSKSCLPADGATRRDRTNRAVGIGQWVARHVGRCRRLQGRLMTGAEKKALIKKLGAKAKKNGFDDNYSQPNRAWFVGKIIDFLPATISAIDGEKKVRDAISGTAVLLKTHLKTGFVPSLKLKYESYKQLISRTQIVYGLVAMHPQLLEPANAKYFKFLLERRFRALQRMCADVNPNGLIFDYPNDEKHEPMQVNASADTFWLETTPLGPPFLLTADGKAAPVDAIQNLFVPQGEHVLLNLFACDPALMSVLLDSLLASKNPQQLLTALIARGDHYIKIDNPGGHFAQEKTGQRLVGISSAISSSGQNVEIEVGRIGPFVSGPSVTQAQLLTDAFIPLPTPTADQPNRFLIVENGKAETFTISAFNPVQRRIRAVNLARSYQPGAKIYHTPRGNPLYQSLPVHVLTDDTPNKALFEQKSIPASDFQVGDHVYFVNHPLYREYYPTGAWTGEHSLLTEIGTRDSASSAFRSDLKLVGHGLEPMTLVAMSTDMLFWINRVIAMVQAVTRIHLRYLKAVKNPAANAEFDLPAGHALVRQTTSKVKFIQRMDNINNVPTAVNLLEYKIPYPFKHLRKGKTVTIKNSKGFAIREKVASQDVAFQVFNNEAPDSSTQPNTTVVAAYIGPPGGDTTKPSNWAIPFFSAATVEFARQPLFKPDDKTPIILTFDDLIKAKPLMVTDDKNDALVIRPRVDFSSTYQAFLTGNGAI